MRRGAVLFEAVMSVAIFAAAAVFVLGAMRSVFRSLHESEQRLLAVDLARSKMAELEAGLVSLNDLRDGRSGVGSAEAFLDDTGDASVFAFEVDTTRTTFPGLSLVELTVLDVEGDEPRAVFTLRQLMPLRDDDPDAYEVDDIVEGLDG